VFGEIGNGGRINIDIKEKVSSFGIDVCCCETVFKNMIKLFFFNSFYFFKAFIFAFQFTNNFIKLRSIN